MNLIDELNKLKDLGYLKSVRHKDFPITIYSYTRTVQYENLFGDYPLLRKCKGLVVEDDGNIVARGYEKFFRYKDHHLSELPLGAKNFVVEKKLDGSLFIVFRYNNQVIYSTKGHFYSDTSKIGEKLFKDMYSEDWIEDGYTYLFELIGPSNRIVNLYEKEDLILHGVLNNADGLDYYTDKPFKKVETYEINNELFGEPLYQQLYNLNINNEEGFVIKVKYENSPTWMCKIKFDNYCQKHAFITETTNIHIWECLANGIDIEKMLDSVPDEFDNFVRKTKESLEYEFDIIESNAFAVFDLVKKIPTRKEQALFLSKNHPKEMHIVFLMLNNEDYNETIWKMVKPKKLIRPFWNKINEI